MCSLVSPKPLLFFRNTVSWFERTKELDVDKSGFGSQTTIANMHLPHILCEDLF